MCFLVVCSYQFVELTIGVLDVLKKLKNLETPLGDSMSSSARTCKEIMLLNSSLPDGKNRPDSTTQEILSLVMVSLKTENPDIS